MSESIVFITRHNKVLVDLIQAIIQQEGIDDITFHHKQCWAIELRPETSLIAHSSEQKWLENFDDQHQYDVSTCSPENLTNIIKNWLRTKYIPYSVIASIKTIGDVYLNENGLNYYRGLDSFHLISNSTGYTFTDMAPISRVRDSEEWEQLASTMTKKIGHFEFYGEK